jgi:hypothetical protein
MNCGHRLKISTLLVLVPILAGWSAFAQGPGSYNPVEPGVDLQGNWGPLTHEDAHDRGAGPELVNYLGMPITDGARALALSYNASQFTIPEHQCEVQIVSYIYRGPINLRISDERDPVTEKLIALKHYLSNYQQTRMIWMDGRPHPPPEAPHTWMGFSTGKFEGNMLTVYTTHIKSGWVRRNGLRQTDQATMTEHFIRHGDQMTHVSIVTDPATFTEPLIRTEDLVLRLQNGQNWLYPCDPVVEVERPRGTVPHYLPGENPFIHEFADLYKIPVEATLGGVETMYPEYRKKIAKVHSADAK